MQTIKINICISY